MSWRSSGEFVVDPDYSSPTELAEGFQVRSESDGESVFSSYFVARPDDTYGTVEHTQSIQFFPSFHPEGFVVPGRGDNDIRLLAGKVTVLRVYLDSTMGFRRTSVRGRAFTRPFGTQTWQGPIADYNGPIDILPRSGVRRCLAGHTLSFRIPAARCHGAVEVRIDVLDPSPRTVAFQELVFHQVVPMRLFLWGISWRVALPEGGSFKVGPLPKSRIRELVERFTKRMFPVAGIDYQGYEEWETHAPPTSESAWDDWLDDLNEKRDEWLTQNIGDPDAPKTTHLAVFPGEGPCVDPCRVIFCCERRHGQRSGSAAIARDHANTIAHELGHVYGGRHVAGCDDDILNNPDAGYPQYASFSRASIGEYGMDTATGEVKGPTTEGGGICQAHSDIMSYCDRQWISPYTYERLMDEFLRKP